MRGALLGLALALALALGVGLAACGGTSGTVSRSGTAARPVPSAAAPGRTDGPDWPTFDFDSARGGVDPSGAAVRGRLTTRRIRVAGVVDSAPIGLRSVRVRGRRRDVVVVTTIYGRTIAIDPGTGARLWQYTPGDVDMRPGNPQVTDASPVADPDRRFVYAAAPDGVVRKLALGDGRRVWSRRVSFDPAREKLGSSLAIDGPYLIVVTGGYYGDAPPYDGHVVAIDRSDGRIAHVWNSECSNVHRLIAPSSCPESGARGDNAIWSRAGAVVVPGSGEILVATGNGPFDGRTNWGDSVLELSPDAATLLHSWTPRNQAALSAGDVDLGSSSPALLGPYAGRQLVVQAGKDGRLHLLDLDRLNGTTGPAGPRLGGELSETASPGGSEVLTQPVAWHHRGRTYLLVADDAGTAAYALSGGRRPRLRTVWRRGTAGTSPVVAGGLLYVYDELGGRLVIRNPLTGAALRTLPAAPGHWNSPIVLDGRIVLPTGNYHGSASTSTLFVYG